MDAKDKFSTKILCNACLCVGETLNLITDEKLKKFYLDTLNEIHLFSVADVSPLLCITCEATLRRTMGFRQQVKHSYQILLSYSKENQHILTDVCRTPRLSIKNNETISISPEEYVEESTNVEEYVEESKNVKNEKIEVKWTVPEDEINRTQQIYLKEHVKIEDERESDNHHSDGGFEPDIQKEINTLIIKKKKKKCVRDKPHKKGSKKGKEKSKVKDSISLNIATIDLSYDELMLERERDMCKDTYANAAYKCESCIIGFLYYKSYSTHLTQKHSETLGDYTCPVCKTIHASVDSITAHYKRHLRRYECRICQKRTMDVKVMQQHYNSTHDISLKNYKCDICGKISNSRDTHRYHRESHRARLQCPKCDKTFRHRAGLMNHRLAVHEFNNKFPCKICNKVFRWRTSLTRHQDSHDNKSKSTAAHCDQCGVSFASLCSYQRHVTNSLKHITKDQLRFICDHCNEKFADKTKLRDHIEEKHLHKTFQCDICLKTSKNRVSLDQHIRNIHKGRPNNKMCHHCGKGFPTKLQLESHIRTHTGERPFICEYCPTTFSQQSNLYKHNRQVHHNVKSKRYSSKKKEEQLVHNPNLPTLNPTNPTLPNHPTLPVAPVSVVLHYSADGYLTAEM